MNDYQRFLDQYFRENYKRFSVIAANQLRRFGIRGDIFELQSDVTQSVLTKFIKHFESNMEELKEIIKKEKLDGYIITSIRNFVSDLRDKQNNDPLGNQMGKLDTDDNEENEEIILNKATSTNYDREVETRNPEKISENRQLYEILCNELDEESVNIWIFSAQGFSSLEIAKKLNINHNTIRTKWKAIRLKAMSILKKSENTYGN